MPALSADAHWYRTAFGPITAGFWTSFVSQGRVEEETHFIAGALRVPRGALLLDVPCGAGRHARALGRLGFRVDGLDVSEHMLAASADPPVEGVTLRKGDMAAIADRDRYDGAVCWGNSFGYLPDEETRSFMQRLARALRPGAGFILETGAIAENILSAFQPRSDVVVSGYRFSAERRYDMAESAIHIRYHIERAGEAEEFVARQSVYTVAEIVRMAAAAGLELDSLRGSIEGDPPALGRSIIFVFKRR